MWFHLFLLSRFAVSTRSAGEAELGGGRPVMSKIPLHQLQQLFPNYLSVAVLDGTKSDPGRCWWQGQIQGWEEGTPLVQGCSEAEQWVLAPLGASLFAVTLISVPVSLGVVVPPAAGFG